MRKLTEFADPIVCEELPINQLREFKQERSVNIDSDTQMYQLKIFTDNGKVRFQGNGIEMASRCWQTYAINADDPLSAIAEYEWEWEFGRGDSWQVRTLTTTKLFSDTDNFYLESEVTAWEQENQVYHRSELQRFERDHY